MEGELLICKKMALDRKSGVFWVWNLESFVTDDEKDWDTDCFASSQAGDQA
ncbi:MAG: hypothetical protein ABNH02_01915 [Pseudomonadales bacterium]|jgi:hypothetical protein